MSAAVDLRDFEIGSLLRFDETASGLVRGNVTTPITSGQFLLHGAHLLQWQPAGHAPALFVSAESSFASGKAVRGGVPLIFPWFGARGGHPESPMHGFARTMEWQFEAARQIEEHTVQVTLRLSANAETRQLWPHDFALRYTMVFSRELTMTLEVENTSTEPFTFEEALHTYFAVEDVRATEVLGLEGAAYLDKTDALQPKTQAAEPIRFTQETDRIFPDSTATCIIHDPGAARRISVEKSGSKTTVVWNPWIAKAKALPDFGDEEWPGMLCIESANVGSDSVTLAPQARHILATRVSVS